MNILNFSDEKYKFNNIISKTLNVYDTWCLNRFGILDEDRPYYSDIKNFKPLYYIDRS